MSQKLLELKALKLRVSPSHLIFEIFVGNMRIRHRTTLNLNLQSISSESKNSFFNFRVVVCRIRMSPTLKSKIKFRGIRWNFLKFWAHFLTFLNQGQFSDIFRCYFPSSDHTMGKRNTLVHNMEFFLFPLDILHVLVYHDHYI